MIEELKGLILERLNTLKNSNDSYVDQVEKYFEMNPEKYVFVGFQFSGYDNQWISTNTNDRTHNFDIVIVHPITKDISRNRADEKIDEVIDQITDLFDNNITLSLNSGQVNWIKIPNCVKGISEEDNIGTSIYASCSLQINVLKNVSR